MEKLEIAKIEALEILDSRGNPTLRVKVTLRGGAIGIASVPSGASTGKYEAHELRDKDEMRYGGKGVLQAIENVEKIITPALLGVLASDSVRCDHIMIALDGTQNKSNLGANTILSVSLAIAKAAAKGMGIPLYRYLGGYTANQIPIPMMNIINGGVHASNGLDVQEFMILPIGAISFSEGVRMCAEIYHVLRQSLGKQGMTTAVGDEGGFAPALKNDEDAIEQIVAAIRTAGYDPGEDVFIGLDVASGDWYKEEKYRLSKSGSVFTSTELIEKYRSLCEKYPIYSIEDGLAEQSLR